MHFLVAYSFLYKISNMTFFRSDENFIPLLVRGRR